MPYANYEDKRAHNKSYYMRRKLGLEPIITREQYWIRRRLESLVNAGVIEVKLEEDNRK